MGVGDKTDKRVVFITAANEDQAAAIAKALVAEGLAACVNIVPAIRSIYTWKGEVCDDRETLLIAKTSAGRFAALADRVKSLHSYEVPEIIAIPITDGAQDYMGWLARTLG